MRRSALDAVCASCRHCNTSSARLLPRTARRYIQINATPSSSTQQQQVAENGANSVARADARFEVLGSPFSMLSASIAASQTLYTRKGTLVGFSGKAENAVSTLSLLEPFRRVIAGVPFIYQRITSTTPYTALVATKSPITSMVVVHLDGRLDWMVAQRNALVAWTGQTLSLSPRLNFNLSMSNWGNTSVTGRGLLALSGKGLIHQVTLKTGEEYVVHPSHVIAYSLNQYVPQPYRFKANTLRFQIPNPTTFLPDSRFWRTMRESMVWKVTKDIGYYLRTWSRRVIWGDRLFLQFHGPATLLVQSRGARISDVLTTREVNEIADAPSGAVPAALNVKPTPIAESTSATASSSSEPTSVSYATVGNQGSVTFEKDSKA